MKYLVIYEKTETGYSAYVPDLPGCIATGDTKQNASANIKEAISFHIEGLKEEGYKAQQADGGAQPGPNAQAGAPNDGNAETFTDAEFEVVK